MNVWNTIERWGLGVRAKSPTLSAISYTLGPYLYLLET